MKRGWPTNFTQKYRFRESDSSSAIPEISRILWNLDFCYHVYQSWSLVSDLN